MASTGWFLLLTFLQASSSLKWHKSTNKLKFEEKNYVVLGSLSWTCKFGEAGMFKNITEIKVKIFCLIYPTWPNCSQNISFEWICWVGFSSRLHQTHGSISREPQQYDFFFLARFGLLKPSKTACFELSEVRPSNGSTIWKLLNPRILQILDWIGLGANFVKTTTCHLHNSKFVQCSQIKHIPWTILPGLFVF